MKKLLALLPLIGAFALVGCGDKEGEAKLEYNSDQVRQNVQRLGNEEGYEVTCEITASDFEGKQTYTVGAKNNFYWADTGSDKIMYQIVEGGVQLYTYDADNGVYEKGYLAPASMAENYESMVDGFGSFLYTAAEYYDTGDFTKVKEVKFLGRSATQYKLKYEAAAYGKAEYEIIVDKATGITLKWSGSGTSYEDNRSVSATYEVTAFKTGAQVDIPKYNDK